MQYLDYHKGTVSASSALDIIPPIIIRWRVGGFGPEGPYSDVRRVIARRRERLRRLAAAFGRGVRA
jgi:hypothetical protein